MQDLTCLATAESCSGPLSGLGAGRKAKPAKSASGSAAAAFSASVAQDFNLNVLTWPSFGYG